MVSRSTIRRRKRSADPEYRKKKSEHFRVFWAVHKDEINARKRARPRGDFRRRYGMSWNDYDELLARQGGVCAICKKKSKRRLCVDHCHACRKVRGLLCHKCNTGLGLFDDDTDRLRAAIAYLERSRREPTLGIGSSDDAGAAGRPPVPPSQRLPIDQSLTRPSPALDRCPVPGSDSRLIHKQKGNRMTQDETASPLGAESLPELALDLVADAPSIAPEQEGGGAVPARERDAVAG